MRAIGGATGGGTTYTCRIAEFSALSGAGRGSLRLGRVGWEWRPGERTYEHVSHELAALGEGGGERRP
jgi:hypothetical protein